MHKSTNKATVPPDEYNSYYVSLAKNVFKCRAKSTKELFSLTQLLYCNISVFSFSPITESEIYKAIDKLKNNKIGSFGIHSKVLKILSAHVSPILSNSFNDCISSCKFPLVMKEATNTDFRPLSIQSSLSKIFEIIMLDQKRIIYPNFPAI